MFCLLIQKFLKSLPVFHLLSLLYGREVHGPMDVIRELEDKKMSVSFLISFQ